MIHRTPLLLTILITLMLFPSRSRATYSFGKLGFGVGVLNPHMNEMRKGIADETESTNLHPYLTAQLPFHFPYSLSLVGHVALGIPQSSDDEDTSKSHHFANLYLQYNWKQLNVFAGPGLLFTRISGEGGTVTLNNGNSTSNFFRPSSTSMASNTTMNLGINWNPITEVSGSFQAMWTNPTVKLRRSLSLALSLFFHLDLWGGK